MLLSSNSRILVVDDVPDNLFLLQTVLEAEGYEVDIASNGAVALAKIQSSPPDLVLLDVMMPGMNGYEVTQQIRENDRLPFVPILLLTAAREASLQQGQEAGANDFIFKPVDFDDLLSQVNRYLQLARTMNLTSMSSNNLASRWQRQHQPSMIRTFEF